MRKSDGLVLGFVFAALFALTPFVWADDTMLLGNGVDPINGSCRQGCQKFCKDEYDNLDQATRDRHPFAFDTMCKITSVGTRPEAAGDNRSGDTICVSKCQCEFKKP